MSATTLPHMLLPEEVAAWLSLTTQAVKKLATKGELPHIRLPHGSTAFDAAELTHWLDTRRVPPVADLPAEVFEEVVAERKAQYTPVSPQNLSRSKIVCSIWRPASQGELGPAPSGRGHRRGARRADASLDAGATSVNSTAPRMAPTTPPTKLKRNGTAGTAMIRVTSPTAAKSATARA